MAPVLLIFTISYMALLFWLARWGDKPYPLAKKISHHPFVYSLALGVYCTSWTYYGAVGTAANATWNYLPILLGPALLFIFGQRLLRKLVIVSKKQNITTIADFISARYGKRHLTAILVTLIALLATIPYIALQLKALSNSFVLLHTDLQISGNIVAFSTTLLMALFAIFFGTRKVDLTEYRSGLMLAMAFESLVKLIALIVVAALACYILLIYQPGMFNIITEQSVLNKWKNTDFLSFNFIGQSIMAAVAILCLPRQFHVTVVENLDTKHLKTARWAFPLYLLLTAIVIIPIATAAIHAHIGAGIPPDSFVLALPLNEGNTLITSLVFIGGLSAATAMIIVATLTLSTMISNDVILPLLLKHKFRPHSAPANFKRKILMIRRISITCVLALALVYQQRVGDNAALASMGLIAFSLVIQLLPAIIGGLYWRKGHAYGVYAGVIAGFVSWMLFLMYPLLNDTIDYGTQQTIITQGTFIALFVNVLCYVSFSIGARESLVDKIQAAAFVTPKAHIQINKRQNNAINATNYDLKILLQTFLGTERCDQLLNLYQLKHPMTPDTSIPDDEFIDYCERMLTGVLGASSAQALISAVLTGKQLAFEEVVTFFDQTTQALQFNQNLLYTSLENLSHGISVVDKNLKLIAWNKRYAELYQYPENFLSIGQPIEEVIQFNLDQGECGENMGEGEINKRLQHLRNGSPHHFIRHRKNGQVIEMTGTPLPDGGFVTSYSDITTHITTQNLLTEANQQLESRIIARTKEISEINRELKSEIVARKNTENALKKAKKQAENANHNKTQFLALASHDILQPLNAARLYLASVNEHTLCTENSVKLTKLGDSLDSSVHLMSSLLEIAQLDQGAMQPVLRHFNIRDILIPLNSEYAILCKDKGLSLKIRPCEQTLYSDTTYLRRIIQNLISNAVKYTQQGKILVGCRKRGTHLRIEVWDTGDGISQLEQNKIFSDFYRVTPSDNQGIGLGLGVVERMARMLAIKLSVNSIKNQGSCFSVEVPLGDVSRIQYKINNTYQLDPTKNLQILMFDDEQKNLDAMAGLLDKWQCNYHSFNKVKQILTYATSQPAPDVILMDYQLNQTLNGIMLIDKLREIWQQTIPAILVTAVNDDKVKAEAKENHIHFLKKPIKPAKLKALLTHIRN